MFSRLLRTGAPVYAAALLVAVSAVPMQAQPAAGATAEARVAGVCVVPGAREPLESIWRPDMGAAIAYARSRTGDIAFAVRSAHSFYAYRPDHVEWSASVVKAMLMVAYLDRPSVAGRPLKGADLALLVPMITRSDNNAASVVDGVVGNGGLDALGARVGMTHFAAVSPVWGETRITARDQSRFLLHIDSYVVPRHRVFAMHLLASITPSQRWGIGRVTPTGWHLYFKGGWGYATGLLDHQVVLLTRGCTRVSLAVLSMYDGSHAYGKATLQGIFARLLRGFPTGGPLYPVRVSAHYAGSINGLPPGSTLSFSTGPSGARLSHAVVSIAAGSTRLCPSAAMPTRYRFGYISVDPRGNFAAVVWPAALKVTLIGHFLVHGRATGTITALGTAPGSSAQCRLDGRFSAHAAD